MSKKSNQSHTPLEVSGPHTVTTPRYARQWKLSICIVLAGMAIASAAHAANDKFDPYYIGLMNEVQGDIEQDTREL
jgi:hypothetical protein